MPVKRIAIKRVDLYEKVWTVPLRILAKEFGLSDVGLAKLCRRNGIPLPGLGHWRLVEVGRPPDRKPLAEIQPGQNEPIVIEARESGPYELPPNSELGPVPRIVVELDRKITHPLAKRTKEMFEPTSKDQRGWLVPGDPKAPHLRVSAAVSQRALRILDALFCAVEEQGHSLTWGLDQKAKIIVDGEEIEPYLEEIFTQRPHALTPEEIARKKKYGYDYSYKWDYVPSGALQLSIEDLPCELRRVKKSWRDGKTRRIENCLSDFLAIIPHFARLKKLVNENRKQEELKRREEQAREEQLARKREEYDRKEKVVNNFLELWQKSKGFNDLANSLGQCLEDSSTNQEQKEKLQEISNWIRNHAKNVDPLAHPDWMIRQFNRPAFSWDD